MAYEFRTAPFVHQREALRRSVDRSSFAFFMEMGAGKTKVVVDEIGILFERGEIDSAIILAPKGVYANWTNKEIPTHMPECTQNMADVVLWDGSDSRASVRERAKLLDSSRSLRILVMNIEALSSSQKAAAFIADFLRSVSSCYGVVDESTCIKNPQAKRTKRAVAVAGRCKYRRIMTGSPVTRSPLDLYSQFEFMGPRLLGFSSYYSFRNRYAVVQEKEFGGRKVQLVVGYKNVDELTDIVGQHSYRVKKEDCLDLPEKTWLTRDVVLSRDQLRIYREIRDQAFAELSDEGFSSPSAAITQLLRLHQVSCGHVIDEDGVTHDLGDARLDVLMEVLDETDDKVVIWANYRHDIHKITARLRREYGEDSVVTYYGETSPAERATAVQRFQEDPSCRFFVSNKTGAYGITLTASSTEVYYSNDYDLERRLQSEDRIHRIGQSRPCTYVDLVARGTVDEKIVAALRAKINIATTIMGDGPKEWLV
jgi:SNF2 family DNA or RNA helicase